MRIQNYPKLFWQYRQIQLMKQMEYRGDFIFWSLVSLMWTVFNYFFFGLLAGINNGIAGWNLDQIFLLMSVFTILDAFTWSFFYHNMMRYTDAVFSGDLNYLLTKPVNTQFLIMSQTNSYNNVLRLFVGIVMLFYSAYKLGLHPDILQIIGFILAIIVVLTFIYFLWFSLSTIAFWVDRINNINDVVPAFRHIWKVPRQVYQGGTSFLLTIILPMGLLASVPAEFLLGVSVWNWLLYLSLFTVCLGFFSNWFFRLSIKKYSGMAN